MVFGGAVPANLNHYPMLRSCNGPLSDYLPMLRLLLLATLLLAFLLPPGRAAAQTPGLYFPPLTGST